MDKQIRPPKPKTYHKAHLISDKGVSALCFKKPRAISLSKASWAMEDDRVTCAKCLAILDGVNLKVFRM